MPKEIKKKRNQILLEFQKNLHKQRKGNLMNNFIKAVIVIITLSLLTANICLADINNKVFDDVLALILKGKYNEALDECNRLERKIDKRLKTELYYLQGTCLLQQEEFELAQDAFKKALPYAKGELSLEIYMGIADSYFQQYNFKQAISIYEQLLSKREDNKNYLAMLYYKLGKAYQKGSLWVKSDFYFKQLKSKFPQSFEAELLKDTDTGGNFFTVQVGCFTSEKNAKKLFSSLTEKGYEAYITELKSNSQALYRVRVGKFTSRLAAEFAERDLKTKEHLPTHIFP